MMLLSFRLAFFTLRSPLLCAFLRLVRIFRHDVLELTPECFDGRELVSDLCNFFEGAVQFVNVLEDELETL
jgi:hypothetical protein